MNSEDRGKERAVAEALVSLADSLVDDYDMIELLHRLAAECVRLLPVDAAGLLLSDQRGALRLVSSSTERARMLELFQLQAEEGPCLDCFRTSRQVSSTDLTPAESRWPRFAAQASAAGFTAVHALPLRLRDETIGALNLFSSTAQTMGADELRIGQALADVATISILQERAIRRTDILNEQLQTALNSRIIIEQAKGVLAERNQIGVNEAFSALRGYARAHNLRLTAVASDVTNGTLVIPVAATDGHTA
ncbi:GAF and ANTAR domain-containing protein [Saccharopolyspora sp. K220]|uniref:GAF and ANTAR domain-containing protein n=1 Tax=Saccharopolyspora soli TaxID=2926618 RepID=UPI001F59B4FB|nr:GAF and ANTAR domain-containing protein [Saccharopolyspora soli]MCI2423339.1 GAF and ANTAR domain-containing protein [Saccharopolyspora soli]